MAIIIGLLVRIFTGSWWWALLVFLGIFFFEGCLGLSYQAGQHSHMNISRKY